MTFSSEHPEIVDVSRHEGFMDIAKLAKKLPVVYGVIARATISWGYQDSHFPYFKKEVRENSKIRIDNGGLPLFFGGYHVVYPDQPVQTQADNFFRTAGDDIAQDYPATIDAELHRNMSVAVIAESIGKHIDIFEARTGKTPVIYSRAGWLNQYVTNFGDYVPDWFKRVDFHLALYGSAGVEHAGPLTSNAQWGVPKGLASTNQLIMQQTSDTIPGTDYGTPNFEKIDINRWQFDEAHLLNYIGYTNPPPQQQTLEQRVDILERVARLHGWVLV